MEAIFKFGGDFFTTEAKGGERSRNDSYIPEVTSFIGTALPAGG